MTEVWSSKNMQSSSSETSSRALIVLDMQNDFLSPGGKLRVVNEPDLVPVVNSLIKMHGTSFDVVVYTQDWHPPNHISFSSQHPGVPILTTIELPQWTQLVVPDHGVQGSWGAEFHEALVKLPNSTVIRKGLNSQIESHSAFYDVLGGCMGLAPFLKERNVKRVFICGIHTDVLVLKTVLDAVRIFSDPRAVTVITDAVRGFVPPRFQASFDEMRAAGAVLATSSELFMI